MLLTNISRLITMEPGEGREGALGVIPDASVRLLGDSILWVGSRSELPVAEGEEEIVDCGGAIVLPGLVECHTHLVYAGSRENEFRQRSEGATYQDIAKAGGGILSTVGATRAASEDELISLAKPRADEALARGITTIEIKSGYGLDAACEEKILSAAQRLGREHAVDVVGTFLGAHVVPKEYRDNRGEYVRLVIEEMIPNLANKGLCRFCDVFVEEGAFDPDEARAIAGAAASCGLGRKLHVDQFGDGGGGKLAAEIGAVSADHLDHVCAEGIRALAKAGTVAVLLPTATFFVGGGHYAPARAMSDAGVKVALSTDFNPGSSPTLDLMLCATMGVTRMGLTTDEALLGITKHAAAAIGLEEEVGSIAPGKRADLVLFDAPNEDYLLYRFGTNFVSKVVKSGKIIT